MAGGLTTPGAEPDEADVWATPAAASEVAGDIGVTLLDEAGEEVGTATFAEGGDGSVAVFVAAEGLPEGEHGIHVHDVGACDPSGTAGGHFNPTGTNNPQRQGRNSALMEEGRGPLNLFGGIPRNGVARRPGLAGELLRRRASTMSNQRRKNAPAC